MFSNVQRVSSQGGKPRAMREYPSCRCCRFEFTENRTRPSCGACCLTLAGGRRDPLTVKADGCDVWKDWTRPYAAPVTQAFRNIRPKRSSLSLVAQPDCATILKAIAPRQRNIRCPQFLDFCISPIIEQAFTALLSAKREGQFPMWTTRSRHYQRQVRASGDCRCDRTDRKFDRYRPDARGHPRITVAGS